MSPLVICIRELTEQNYILKFEVNVASQVSHSQDRTKKVFMAVTMCHPSGYNQRWNIPYEDIRDDYLVGGILELKKSLDLHARIRGGSK